MSTAAAIALVFAVVSLCGAAFNGWVWWLRRSHTAHLWLALAAVGVAFSGGLSALLYDNHDPNATQLIQRTMLAFGSLIILGFTRFSTDLLSVQSNRYRSAALWIAVACLLLAAVPGAFFSAPTQTSLTSAATSAAGMPRVTPTPIGSVFLISVLALFLCVIALFIRNLDRLGENRGLMLGVVLIWFAAGANDIAVGMGLYAGPLLISVGYVGFVVGFTAILTRRMTHSMNAVERSAQYLQALVEKRTEELRKRELQLALGEKMATIGTLAAGVAHEINTPIAFVTSGFNRLDELRRSPDEITEVHEILSECRDGVDRIRTIVSDLLDLAKTRDDEAEGQAVELREIVASALPIVSAEARDRASIVEDHAPDVPAIEGDPHQLGQVVVNLVMNALQAIEPGHPERNRVTIQTRYYEGVVQLIVRDTGPGIPEDVRAQVFDPFFTTKASEGTGLGLAVTRQLVTQHRGQITLENTPEGTDAIVSLPPHFR